MNIFSSINLVDEILKHSDAEIISFLASEMAGIDKIMRDAVKDSTPEKVYMADSSIDLVTRVLRALDNRNKENDV